MSKLGVVQIDCARTFIRLRMFHSVGGSIIVFRVPSEYLPLSIVD